jgi:hypothetical protein
MYVLKLCLGYITHIINIYEYVHQQCICTYNLHILHIEIDTLNFKIVT